VFEEKRRKMRRRIAFQIKVVVVVVGSERSRIFLISRNSKKK